MPYRDRRSPKRRRVAALLLAARGRGAIKRLGAWLDEQGRELRPALLEEARLRGVELPPEAGRWPGKRLLRCARGEEARARQRRNPIKRDEAFRCAHCGLQVPPGGGRVRNHCPACLRSLHVDLVPGDRAADCGGLMDPVAVEHGGRAELVIVHRCRRCGAGRRNRAMLEGAWPDEPAALRRLSALGPRWEEEEPQPRPAAEGEE